MVSASRGVVRWFLSRQKPRARDARRTGAGGKQRGLAHAKSLLGARTDDALKTSAFEKSRTGCSGPGRVRRSKAKPRARALRNPGILFENRITAGWRCRCSARARVLGHLSSFIRRQAPWNSALDWSARPSTTRNGWRGASGCRPRTRRASARRAARSGAETRSTRRRHAGHHRAAGGRRQEGGREPERGRLVKPQVG